jgi:hypothetical protein
LSLSIPEDRGMRNLNLMVRNDPQTKETYVFTDKPKLKGAPLRNNNRFMSDSRLYEVTQLKV